MGRDNSFLIIRFVIISILSKGGDLLLGSNLAGSSVQLVDEVRHQVNRILEGGFFVTLEVHSWQSVQVQIQSDHLLISWLLSYISLPWRQFFL